jgi:RNA-dependent RNA polymerase
MKDGRMLYGIVDDTNSLDYGEVFIQISGETDDDEEEALRVITAERVLVTRMPCHHPGDVLLLTAVDKPRLRHLVDCIVFPAKGRRPHPTEMSGGDLDGDEYWACWNEKLVDQVKCLYPAAEYAAPEKPKIDGEPTMEMMVDFILDILVNGDQVGILSRRHLALSTRHTPAHPDAIDLARHISDSLDFPKTGVSSMTPKLFRSLNVHDYPDFMQNKMKKTFESDKVLGILFRDLVETLTIHSSLNDTVTPVFIDQDLLVDGYQTYLGEAKTEYDDYCSKMQTIMNTYDLQHESELITGCHFGIPEEYKNNDDVETATQEFRSLRMAFKRAFDNSMADRSVRRFLFKNDSHSAHM